MIVEQVINHEQLEDNKDSKFKHEIRRHIHINSIKKHLEYQIINKKINGQQEQ